MNSVIFSSPLLMALLANALIFALLHRFGRRKLLWGVASALSAVFAILAGLVLGETMKQLLLALLLPTAVSFSSCGSQEGGEQDEL